MSAKVSFPGKILFFVGRLIVGGFSGRSSAITTLKKVHRPEQKIPRLIAIARISILRVEGEWDLHICDRANIMITVTAATNRQCWVGM